MKRYEINDDDGNAIVINEGDGISIPIFGIHRDPQFYPKPNKFDPERFSDTNKKEHYTIFVFTIWNGSKKLYRLVQRICCYLFLSSLILSSSYYARSRFALMECKAFIFYLLSAFTFEVAATTTIPLKLLKGFTINAEGGFNIHMKVDCHS